MEDFYGMKRKQLQALCKKHGVPANLTNCEMANRLSLLFKEEGKRINQVQSCSKDLGEISSENYSKVVNNNVKKVRFSPENETFVFVCSDSDSDSDKEYTPVKKRVGRRRSKVKSISKEQVESSGVIEVSGKVMDGQVRITRSRAQKVVEGDAKPLVGKKRPRRGAKVESAKDIGVSGKPPPAVDLASDVAGDRNYNAMAKRGSRKTRKARGSDGVDMLDNVSEGNADAEEGAKHEKLATQPRPDVTKKKGSAALSRVRGKVEIVSRITRSRTQLEGKSSEVNSGTRTVEVQEEGDEVLQLEPLKGFGRKVSRQKSVGTQNGKIKIRILAGEGAEPVKAPWRSKRNAAMGDDSNMLTRELKTTKAFGTTRGSKAQIVVKAFALDDESETLAVQEECEEGHLLEEPLKRPNSNASRRESVVSRKRSKNTDMEGAPEVEPSVEPRREIEKVTLPNGRPRRSGRNTSMFSSTASRVGDLVNHETFGKSRHSRESLQEESSYAAEEPLRRSRRNAFRNNLLFISGEVDKISVGAREDERMKRRGQDPNLKEEGSVTEHEHLIEKPPRCTTRKALKSGSVAPAAPTRKSVEKEQRNKKKSITFEDCPSSANTSVLAGPATVDTWPVVLDTSGCQIDPDSCCMKEISGNSIEKQKGSTKKSSANQGFNLLEVSAVKSDLKGQMDSHRTIEGTLPPPLKLFDISVDQRTGKFASESVVVNEKENTLPQEDITAGDWDDQSCQLNNRVDISNKDLVKLKPVHFENKVRSVVSPGNASPAACLLPLYQSGYGGEALNLSEWKSRSETEESLVGENTNLRNEKGNDQSAGDDQTSVQEDQNLQDANEIVEPTIPELVIEDCPSKLRESRCLKRNFNDTPSDKVEEFSALGLFEGEEISQAEIFVGAAEGKQLIAETGERTSGHSARAATPFRPSSERQVSGISNDVVANSLDISSPKKYALEEEKNQPGAQSVTHSTILERSNDNHVGEEKDSSCGIEISNETIFIGETSISDEAEKMGREFDVTNKDKNEGAFHGGRVLPAPSEELIKPGSEQYLRKYGGCLSKLDNSDAQAVEDRENEVSDGKNWFDVTRMKCMHELSSGRRITPIIPEDRDTDRVENAFTAVVVLKSAGTAAKGIASSEPTSQKDNAGREGGPDAGNKNLSSCKQKLLVDTDVQENEMIHLKDQRISSTIEVVDTEEETEARSAQTGLRYENPEDSVEKEVESVSLHFALEDLQGGNKCETVEVTNSLDEVLSRSEVGVCSAERSAEGKVTSYSNDSEAFPLDASTVVSCSELFAEKGYDHEDGVTQRKDCVRTPDDRPSSKISIHLKDMAFAEGLEGEFFVEEHDQLGVEESLDCCRQVELGDHSVWEMAGQVNQSADSTSSEDISTQNQVFENTAEMLDTSKFIKGVGILKEEGKSPVVLERSDASFMDGDALQQVTSSEFGNLFLEGELTESDESPHNDDKCRHRVVAPDVVVHRVTMEKMDSIEAEQGANVLPVVPVEYKKKSYSCGGEFREIDGSAFCAFNEVPSKYCQILETSIPVVQTILQMGELGFSNVENQRLEGSPELGKRASIGLDCPMSKDDTIVDSNGKFGTLDGGLELNNVSSEAENKVCNVIQFIQDDTGPDLFDQEVGAKDIDYDISLNYPHGDKRLAADEAGAGSIGRKNDAEKVEDRARWFEQAPVFDISSKWDEKDTEKVNSFADTGCGKPEMHSSGVIGSLPSVSSANGDEDGFHIFMEGNSYDARTKEMIEICRDTCASFLRDNDALSEERVGAQKYRGLFDANARKSRTTSQEFAEGQHGAVIHFNGIDSLTLNEPSSKGKGSVEEPEEAFGFNRLDEMTDIGDNSRGYADFQNVHVVTPKKSDVGADHATFSPVVVLPSFENKSLEFHLDSKISSTEENDLIAEQGNIEISNGALESNFISENLISREKNQQVAKLLGVLENQAHFSFSSGQNDTSVTIQEYIDCGNYESFCVSSHKMMLMEADEINGCNATSGRPMAESTPDEAEICCNSTEEKVLDVNASEHDIIMDHIQENFIVETDQASETRMDATIGSENIKDASEWDERNSADPKVFVARSLGTTQLGQSCATTSTLDVLSLHGEDDRCCGYSKFVRDDSEGKEMANEDRETKTSELNGESHAFTTWELNLTGSDSKQDEVEKSEGSSLANPISKTSEDSKEGTENEVIVRQVAEEQHGDHEHHMAEDVELMVGTHLAVSDEPTCGNDGRSKKQGEVSVIIQKHNACENYEDQFIKGGISNNSKHSEIPDAAEMNGSNHVNADEVMVGCGQDELKQLENSANPGAEDIEFSVEVDGYEHMVETMELGGDLPKINATIPNISPDSTAMVCDRDIAAEVSQTPQLNLLPPKTLSPGLKAKETNSLFAIHLSSSAVKGTKHKTSLIPRTPKNVLKTFSAKEKMPSTKNDQNGNMTAAKTVPKRRPLEDLRNN